MNDIVAIGPEIIDEVVLLKPLALAKACDIEPVAAPLFTIVRAGQQAVDQPFPGLRIGIGDKSGDLFRSWRQSGQIVLEAADESASIGARSGVQPLRRQSGIDETIERRPGPGGGNTWCGGWSGVSDRLQ